MKKGDFRGRMKPPEQRTDTAVREWFVQFQE